MFTGLKARGSEDRQGNEWKREGEGEQKGRGGTGENGMEQDNELT